MNAISASSFVMVRIDVYTALIRFSRLEMRIYSWGKNAMSE
jgi:hypothetical protein